MRIGYGWDSHEFRDGIPLKIGGIELPHSKGLAGHSDGDVLLHALTDALLGAVAAGDIGTHFPPSDDRWKGADSASFVREALRLVATAGFTVVNLDSTLILAQPKIGPHAAKIQAAVAELVGVSTSAVGIKAKTPEGMGTDNAAIAHVIVLLQEKRKGDRRLVKAVEEVPQPEMDRVVNEVLKEVPSAPKNAPKAVPRNKKSDC